MDVFVQKMVFETLEEIWEKLEVRKNPFSQRVKNKHRHPLMHPVRLNGRRDSWGFISPGTSGEKSVLATPGGTIEMSSRPLCSEPVRPLNLFHIPMNHMKSTAVG